jgi:magnesium transporter
MGRVVAAAAYSAGRRVAEITLEEGKAWSDKPGHLVWIGIHEPGPDELRSLQRQFGLHDLAIEDALTAHQRPKAETYGDTLFLVLRTVQRRGEGVVEFGETHIFAGKGYVISVRHGPSSSYAKVRERLESSPALLRHGEDYIVHAILDFVVDCFMPVLERVEAEVVDLDERILRKGLSRTKIASIHNLRGELRRLRHAAAPLIDVCRRIEHLRLPFIDDAIRPYFRDVADHVQRVNETIDSLGEILDHSFEAGLLLESSHQNEIGRRFAAWAAILAVPTAIAGIYGMNFENMPELTWRYGYFMVLGLIALVCAGLFRQFRRSGWL